MDSDFIRREGIPDLEEICQHFVPHVANMAKTEPLYVDAMTVMDHYDTQQQLDLLPDDKKVIHQYRDNWSKLGIHKGVIRYRDKILILGSLSMCATELHRESRSEADPNDDISCAISDSPQEDNITGDSTESAPPSPDRYYAILPKYASVLRIRERNRTGTRLRNEQRGPPPHCKGGQEQYSQRRFLPTIQHATWPLPHKQHRPWRHIIHELRPSTNQTRDTLPTTSNTVQERQPTTRQIQEHIAITRGTERTKDRRIHTDRKPGGANGHNQIWDSGYPYVEPFGRIWPILGHILKNK